MLLRVPDYDEAFHCLAGACPHTCCAGWEVELDDDTVARYAAVPSKLGQRLRAAMETDEAGVVCFASNGGRCPFLDGENLCEIHRKLGEAATSATCRAHPRFTEEFGPLREISLTASCPAAAELLLGSVRPLTFVTRELSEREEPGDEWLAPLLTLRERILTMLRDRTVPLPIRLADCLRLSREAQLLLDDDRADALPALAGAWSGSCAAMEPESPELFPYALRVLKALERSEADWFGVLAAAETAEGPVPDDCLLERIAAYFVFRWLLKAVNDGDVLGRMALCVFSVLVIRRLAAVTELSDALERYCREIEHSEENLETLCSAFYTDPDLGPEILLGELATMAGQARGRDTGKPKKIVK